MAKASESEAAETSQGLPAWGDLQALQAIAESGSVSRAAAQLKTSQGNVARRLDELETRLGTKLFDRSASGVSLTDAGRHVYELVVGMGRVADQIDRTVRKRDEAGAARRQSEAGPFNTEAERALIGAILFDNGTLEQITKRLTAEQFYDPVNARLFETISRLIRAGRLADGVTLKEEAARLGTLQELGGATYLLQVLQDAAPLAAHAQSYAELIVDLAVRRQVVEAAGALAQAARDPSLDLAELRELARRTESLASGAHRESTLQADAVDAAILKALSDGGRTPALHEELPSNAEVLGRYLSLPDIEAIRSAFKK